MIVVLNPDALAKTKKAFNRPRDKAAILQLESIKTSGEKDEA